MISAPRVNQMRFLSSSALEKADQLILAASCSAADAIVHALRLYRGADHAPLSARPGSGPPRQAIDAIRTAAYAARRSNHMAFPRRNATPSGSSSSAGRDGFSLQRLDATAGLFDRLDGALRRAVDFELRRGFQFALAEQLH